MGVAREYGHTISEGPTPADVAGAPALPYPSGWSALAFSHELRPGTVLTRPLAGRDVVLYRTGTGALRAVRPYCPHLGAHLGLAKVEGRISRAPSTSSRSAPTARASARGTAHRRRVPR